MPATLRVEFEDPGIHLPSSMGTGFFHIELTLALERAQGTLRPTGTLILPALRGTLAGILGCTACPRTLVFPPIQRSFTAVGHLAGGDLHASVFRSLAFSARPSSFPPPIFPPVYFGIHAYDAQEIDRVVIPEPGSLPLLAGGLVTLGSWAAWRRLRARG